MTREVRDNSGTLGKNDRRERDEQPTHTGSALIDGRDYWISAWVKESARGKFFSLSFRPKDAASKPTAPARQPATSSSAGEQTYAEVLDDGIPF